MGAIGGMFGLAGGESGTGQELQAGVSPYDITQAQDRTNGALDSQQALIASLQGQNGLGNQNQVYNQLQDVYAGRGPNPAQAMLNQSTGQNVSNQAALMAGQRGAGANVGLMARQAAGAGANAQQQAAGQAATMQANQSMGALGQAGSMANTMAQNQIGTQNAYAANALRQLQGIQSANAQMNAVRGGLANTGIQGQQGMFGGFMSGFGNMSAMGGSGGGGGGGMAMMAAAEGGEVPGVPAGPGADTGSDLDKGVQDASSLFFQFMNTPNKGAEALAGNSYKAGKTAGNMFKGTGNPGSNLSSPQMGSQFSESNYGLGVSGASKEPPAPTLGADTSLPAPQILSEYSRGGDVGSKLKAGGAVPGKAKVPGNSYANDTVSAKLSPGEVVIPRDVMQSKDPARGAADFVRAVLAKKGMRK